MSKGKVAGRIVVTSIVGSVLWLGESSAFAVEALPAPPPEESDARAWLASQSQPAEQSWATPKRATHSDHWDAGGTLIPSLQVPILLTDPHGMEHVSGTPKPSVGYGLEWRLGYAFGRLSVEGLGGFASQSNGGATVETGQTLDLTLDRKWIGGQLRYTFVHERVSPFLGLGATAEYWTINTIFRPNRKFVSADGVLTPAVHVVFGTLIRVFKIEEAATIFIDLGMRAGYAFADDLIGSSQIMVSPYLGLSVMGATPSLFGSSSNSSSERKGYAASK